MARAWKPRKPRDYDYIPGYDSVHTNYALGLFYGGLLTTEGLSPPRRRPKIAKSDRETEYRRLGRDIWNLQFSDFPGCKKIAQGLEDKWPEKYPPTPRMNQHAEPMKALRSRRQKVEEALNYLAENFPDLVRHWPILAAYCVQATEKKIRHLGLIIDISITFETEMESILKTDKSTNLKSVWEFKGLDDLGQRLHKKFPQKYPPPHPDGTLELSLHRRIAPAMEYLDKNPFKLEMHRRRGRSPAQSSSIEQLPMPNKIRRLA